MYQYIESGKVTSVRGIEGEIKVEPWCNTPSDFCVFKVFFIKISSCNTLKLKVINKKIYKNNILLKLENINSKEKASELVGKILYVKRENINLSKNEHLLADLINLRAVDVRDESVCYGIVTDIITRNTKTLIYEITNKHGKKHLIPATKEFVTKIDTKEGKIKINPIPGLLNNAY